MKLTVNVTAEDIDKGRRNSCTHCPVARAILRDANATMVDVDHRFIRWWDGAFARRLNIATPEVAASFIVRFDARPGASTIGHLRSDFAPFSFELEIPEVTP